MPERAGPHPAILLLTGSGPQNRNEEVYGHRPFLVIADYLTRQGFAVLRVDDRGVGASTGVFDRNLTLGDLTLDALAGLRYLQSRSEIKQDSIGLLGHSQGGVIASRVALEAEVAFIITLAAPSVTEGEVSIESNRLIAELEGISSEIISLQIKLFEGVQKLVLEGANADAIRSYLQSQLSQAEKQALDLTDQDIEKIASQYDSPYMRSVLAFDPLPNRKALNMPVLELFAELDMQVAVAQNVPPLEQAYASHPDATIHSFPKLNHLFQTAVTGHPKEYTELAETINPEVLEVIAIG